MKKIHEFEEDDDETIAILAWTSETENKIKEQ